jgi:hypothetical protein
MRPSFGKKTGNMRMALEGRERVVAEAADTLAADAQDFRVAVFG